MASGTARATSPRLWWFFFGACLIAAATGWTIGKRQITDRWPASPAPVPVEEEPIVVPNYPKVAPETDQLRASLLDFLGAVPEANLPDRLPNWMGNRSAEQLFLVLTDPIWSLQHQDVRGLVCLALIQRDLPLLLQRTEALPPSPDRDRTLTDVVLTWGALEPEKALVWALKQGDSPALLPTAGQVTAAWWKHDAPACERWLTTACPEPRRAALLRSTLESGPDLTPEDRTRLSSLLPPVTR